MVENLRFKGGGMTRGVPVEKDEQLEAWDTGPGLSMGQKGASFLPDRGMLVTDSAGCW